MSWSIAETWNKALEAGEERPLKPRTRIWASEVGGSYIDRYLKMKAIPPSNPFDNRSKRKFEAGKLMEGLVKLIMVRAGIFQASQEWLSYQYPGLLEVTGKLDIVAGGTPDVAKAKQVVDELQLEEWFGEGFVRASLAVIAYLQQKYPQGLPHKIIEVKSTSAMMYDVRARRGADPHHRNQLFHYLKAKNMKEGSLIYISKDDLRLQEFVILNPSTAEDDYRRDIEQMTAYIAKDEMPPLEPEILFDPNEIRFSKNWRVEYSGYLTKLYKYQTPSDYADQIEPIVGRWNRVLARIKDGKDMTANNLEALAEIERHSPQYLNTINQLREKIKATNAKEEKEKQENVE